MKLSNYYKPLQDNFFWTNISAITNRGRDDDSVWFSVSFSVSSVYWQAHHILAGRPEILPERNWIWCSFFLCRIIGRVTPRLQIESPSLHQKWCVIYSAPASWMEGDEWQRNGLWHLHSSKLKTFMWIKESPRFTEPANRATFIRQRPQVDELLLIPPLTVPALYGPEWLMLFLSVQFKHQP